MKILHGEQVPTPDAQYEEPIAAILARLQPQLKTIEKSDVSGLKYDLPVKNANPEFQSLEDILEKEKSLTQTPNQKLWQLLLLNENTSYQVYEGALQQRFSSELDMYGDFEDNEHCRELQIQSQGQEMLQLYKLQDQNYMDAVRASFEININLPGCMENEHPHRFLQNLRPLEDFRNTPLIPISDRQVREHKEMLERYHRGAFMFEIKKETILNYSKIYVSQFSLIRLTFFTQFNLRINLIFV